MSRLDRIVEKKYKKPPRVMIMGTPGIGKTSFGAKGPNPIAITPEGGADEIPGLKEMPDVKTWGDVCGAVKELLTTKHPFQTLVLDSADWIEKLCHAEIIKGTGKTIVTVNKGYGAGYRASEQMHRELISDLTELREKKGMHIVVTAHPMVKTVKDPDAPQEYECFQIKCHEYVSALWREWVDALLFARWETHVKVDDEAAKGRAIGTGKRLVFTTETPSFQAKNRYRLPHVMEFTEHYWNDFMKAAGHGITGLEELRAECDELLKKVSDVGLSSQIANYATENWNNPEELAAIRGRLKELTK